MSGNIGSTGSLNSRGSVEDDFRSTQARPMNRAGTSGTRVCRALSEEELRELGNQQYFDGTAPLERLKLLPEDGRRVAVPREKVDEFNQALADLEKAAFRLPLEQPLGPVEFRSVKSLQNMRAIPDGNANEVFMQSHQLRSERAISASPSVASPGDVVPPAGRPASPATHRSGSVDDISALPRRASGNRHFMRSSQTNLTGTSMPPTDQTALNRKQVEYQAVEVQGTNKNDQDLSWKTRIRRSDYFPQRKLSAFFLGVIGMAAWGAYEYIKQGGISMQDPNKPRGLIAYQMLAVPLGLMPSLIFIYMHLNRHRKLGIEEKLAALTQSNEELRKKVGLPLQPVGAAAAGPANVV